MRVKLTEGEQARYWRERAGEVNREAYEKILQARWYVRQVDRGWECRGPKIAEEVIALEPQWANAYAVLACSPL